jgi:plastocyanin
MRPFPLASAAALSFLLAPHAMAQPAQVAVQVWSFGFAPRPLHLAAGKPVTLTFINQSGGSHDFTAREFFAASTISAGTAPGGKVTLSGHETKSITLVPRAGSYEAHCTHFLHASMGMTDQIIVN